MIGTGLRSRDARIRLRSWVLSPSSPTATEAVETRKGSILVGLDPPACGRIQRRAEHMIPKRRGDAEIAGFGRVVMLGVPARGEQQALGEGAGLAVVNGMMDHAVPEEACHGADGEA